MRRILQECARGSGVVAGLGVSRSIQPVDSAMGEIVNLRKARKRAAKQRDAERAAANRLTHGRSKAERASEATRSEQTRRFLDAHKIDTGDAQ
jgi:hypothetical protein